MITDGTSFPVILKLSGKLGGLVRHRIPLIFVPGCFFSSLLYICLWDFLNFLLHQENILSAFNSKQIVGSVVKIAPGNEIFLQFCLTSKLLSIYVPILVDGALCLIHSYEILSLE